jgi:hypothetical protein
MNVPIIIYVTMLAPLLVLDIVLGDNSEVHNKLSSRVNFTLL